MDNGLGKVTPAGGSAQPVPLDPGNKPLALVTSLMSNVVRLRVTSCEVVRQAHLTSILLMQLPGEVVGKAGGSAMFWQEVDGRTTGRLAGLWSLTDASQPSVAARPEHQPQPNPNHKSDLPARETRKKYQQATFDHEQLSTPVSGNALLKIFFDKDYWQQEAWRQDSDVLAAHAEVMEQEGDVPMVQVTITPSITLSLSRSNAYKVTMLKILSIIAV